MTRTLAFAVVTFTSYGLALHGLALADGLTPAERQAVARGIQSAVTADFNQHMQHYNRTGLSCFVGEKAPYTRLTPAQKTRYLNAHVRPEASGEVPRIQATLDQRASRVSCIGQTMEWIRRGLVSTLGDRGAQLYRQIKDQTAHPGAPGVSPITAPALQAACASVLGAPCKAPVLATDSRNPPSYQSGNYAYMLNLARAGRSIYGVATDRNRVVTDFRPTGSSTVNAAGGAKLAALAEAAGEGACFVGSLDGGYHCPTIIAARDGAMRLDLYAAEAHLSRNPGRGDRGETNIELHRLAKMFENVPEHGHLVLQPIYAPGLGN